MFFNILEANQNYTHSEDYDDFCITFTLSLTEGDYIEIGKEYAVASMNKQWLLKDKKFVNTSISFYDISSVKKTAPVAYQNLLQSDKKVIGIGMFVEETETDFQTYPGLLGFQVWLSSKAYNHLFSQLLNKNIPSAINIDLKGLKYGWEPDGSHTIWDIDKNNIDDILRISRVSIHYKLQQKTALDIEAAKIIKEREQDEKKELLANSGDKPGQVIPSDSKKILSNIYSLLIVIAVLLAISIYKH
jgi:hypothetical protein